MQAVFVRSSVARKIHLDKSCCGYGHSSKLKSAPECATQGERYEERYFYCFF